MPLPFLNDVKIIANLAVTPELSLTRKGRRYCNFSMRMMFRDERGRPITDFVNVTAYDDDAEMVVRDCKVGDLLFVNGYFTNSSWEKGGYTHSKLVIIAYCVQLLGVNDGMPDIDSTTPSKYPYKGFMDGESTYISSFSIGTRNENTKKDKYLYPQPKQDGTWTIPNATDKPTQGTVEFLKTHPAVVDRMLGASPVDDDDRLARWLLPENLPVRTVNGKRVVFKPDGRYITEQAYTDYINRQRKFLDDMATERRMRVLSIAEEKYGFVRKIDNGLPAVATDEEIAVVKETEQKRKFAPFRPDFVPRQDMSVNRSEGLGDEASDWYQDANGEWHLK